MSFCKGITQRKKFRAQFLVVIVVGVVKKALAVQRKMTVEKESRQCSMCVKLFTGSSCRKCTSYLVFYLPPYSFCFCECCLLFYFYVLELDRSRSSWLGFWPTNEHSWLFEKGLPIHARMFSFGLRKNHSTVLILRIENLKWCLSLCGK